MKVLVTGPDGVLGSNIVRELLSQNYQVVAMAEDGKASPTIDSLPITKVGGNLLNTDDIDRAVRGVDYVIHCAAITSMFPARSEVINKVNIGGTQSVIDACITHKVKRLIYIGTANSFASGTKENPGTEQNGYDGAKYGLDYMDSKYEAQLLVQQAVKERGLDAVVINPTFMIGPYDSKPSSGQMILSVFNGKVPGYGDGGKNFVAVKDVALAATRALTRGEKGNCYIVGNENLTYKEAFDKISQTLNCKKISRRLSPWAMNLFGNINSRLATILGYTPGVTKQLARLASEGHYYSADKAQKELDLTLTPINSAIAECFEWFKVNGYVK